MSIRNALAKAVYGLLDALPPSKTVVFESVPVYADNTRAVYDEMVRRGLHRHYRFVWLHARDEVIPAGLEQAKLVPYPPRSLWERLRLRLLFATARAFISCNTALPVCRGRQYAICLMHGAPLKYVRTHYTVPEGVTEALSFSSHLAPLEQINVGVPMEKIQVLGYPRNDELLRGGADVHALFPDVAFTRWVYWMPTYRQHKNGEVNTSSIAMPILYDEAAAARVNEAAAQNGVLVVVKPHFAQDVSRIKTMALSHLRFIDDDFLKTNGIGNYHLLAAADALLTDYSSVYYDYLLTDRPIGLCWDDYEDYRAREGFVVDMDTVMAGGEKIYNGEQLCAFLARLAAGEDTLADARRQVAALIHDYRDDGATRRVTDHILARMEAPGRK